MQENPKRRPVRLPFSFNHCAACNVDGMLTPADVVLAPLRSARNAIRVWSRWVRSLAFARSPYLARAHRPHPAPRVPISPTCLSSRRASGLVPRFFLSLSRPPGHASGAPFSPNNGCAAAVSSARRGFVSPLAHSRRAS